MVLKADVDSLPCRVSMYLHLTHFFVFAWASVVCIVLDSGSELSPMPYRFVLAENLDMEKAWQRWENTLAWRKENGADDVLSRPHPK